MPLHSRRSTGTERERARARARAYVIWCIIVHEIHRPVEQMSNSSQQRQKRNTWIETCLHKACNCDWSLSYSTVCLCVVCAYLKPVDELFQCYNHFTRWYFTHSNCNVLNYGLPYGVYLFATETKRSLYLKIEQASVYNIRTYCSRLVIQAMNNNSTSK